MDIITLQNYQTYVLATGDIFYSPTNHVHYILTYAFGDNIKVRPVLYGLGNYGTEIALKRRDLVGMLVIQGGAG